MRAVPKPHLTLAAAALAVAALVVGLVVASGGGERRPAPARAAHVATRPALLGGAPLQRARCAQWRRGTLDQQRATVRALAATVGGPSGRARGTTLAEADAVAMFDRACADRVARNFLLYEMYIRAAGFKSLRAPAQ